MDISRWIEGWAAFQGPKPALRFEGREVSYGALDAAVRRTAALLEGGLGIRRGDRVAHLGLNSPDLIVLLFACARVGAMLCPLNWRLAPPEHAAILESAQAKAVFAEPAFLEGLESVLGAPAPLRRVAWGPPRAGWEAWDALQARAEADVRRPSGHLEDGVLLVYTSGTTGRPKGAVLTQNALFWNAVNSTHAHDLTAEDRILSFLPMFHVGGMNIMTTPALHAGATVTLQRRFDPDAFFDALAADRPTLTLMVPAVMQAIQSHPRFAEADLSCLRLINAGSSTIPHALIEGFHKRGVPVCQIYGSTETCPIAVYLRAEDAFSHVGSTGKPAIHCDLRLVDDAGRDVPDGAPGELWVRGPNVMSGYWQDEEATAQVMVDGWFRTGDVGVRDAEGFVTINDRRKDLIISGGENIYPAELENVLMDIDGVREAAVIGRPDPKWGEVAVAVLVADPGLDRAAVLGAFEGRLARFKHPRDVVFVDSLPRNVMGKVLKFELRARLVGPDGAGGAARRSM